MNIILKTVIKSQRKKTKEQKRKKNWNPQNNLQNGICTYLSIITLKKNKNKKKLKKIITLNVNRLNGPIKDTEWLDE